jgi:hypothetical protein
VSDLNDFHGEVRWLETGSTISAFLGVRIALCALVDNNAVPILVGLENSAYGKQSNLELIMIADNRAEIQLQPGVKF